MDGKKSGFRISGKTNNIISKAFASPSIKNNGDNRRQRLIQKFF